MSYHKTTSLSKSDVPQKWIVINAKNMILGRLASDIASILKGKTHAGFTPHADTGTNVIVINSKLIRVTGNKLTKKFYIHHTGWMGGLKSISYRDLMKKDPAQPLLRAVKGMLPKNSLGRKLHHKIRVYPGSDHPHIAQQPQTK